MRLVDAVRSANYLPEDANLWHSWVQQTYGKPTETPVLQTFQSYAERGHGGNGVVFGLMLARAMLFSEATFQWRNQTTKELFGTAELATLEDPWPNGTTGELLVRMIQDADLAGNAFIRRDADRLVRLRPDWVDFVLVGSGQDTERSRWDVLGYTHWLNGPGSEREFYPVEEVAHWCADEETEILTADGWKDFRALAIGDEVLTLNHETGLSEWQPVSNVGIFPAQRREMLSMEGRDHSSLTTLNHRWPMEYRISRRNEYGRRWVTSETIGSGDRIPVAAYSSDLPVDAKWQDALVETVAWFWTEGRYSSGRNGTKGRGISIGQSANVNADNVARIRAALTALFGAPVDRIPKTGPRMDQPACWRESRDDDMVIFRLSANAGDVITAHAPGKVVTTEFLRSLTAAQLELFIKVSLLADNCGPNRLAQKDKRMAEQFALACTLAGHAVSIRESFPDRAGRYGNSSMWNVRMLRKRHVYPQMSDRPGSAFRAERVQYDGQVWCPVTPNGTWLARRRGTVYFTGNSPIPDPMSDYRGMSWLTPVAREINADLAMTDYKRRFMDNSATPNLLIKYQQKLTPAALDRVREVWNARYGGTDGQRTAILDSGADHSVIGSTLQAIDFANVQAAGENRIAVAAGVPGIVAGLKEGLAAATYSNYEQAMRRFADITMRPLWRSACACLASILTVPPGAKLWYDTSDIAALRQGEKERAETMNVNAITANTLITAGYEPASVVKAITSGDMGQLRHTGMTSVQLQKPGSTDPTPPVADMTGEST